MLSRGSSLSRLLRRGCSEHQAVLASAYASSAAAAPASRHSDAAAQGSGAAEQVAAVTAGLQRLKEQLAAGPDLGDFVAGDTAADGEPRAAPYSVYAPSFKVSPHPRLTVIMSTVHGVAAAREAGLAGAGVSAIVMTVLPNSSIFCTTGEGAQAGLAEARAAGGRQLHAHQGQAAGAQAVHGAAGRRETVNSSCHASMAVRLANVGSLVPTEPRCMESGPDPCLRAAGVRGGAVPQHRGVLGRRGGPDRHRHHHAHGRHLHPVRGDMAVLEVAGHSVVYRADACLRVLLCCCHWANQRAEGPLCVYVVIVVLLSAGAAASAR
jgi:hypothetical protein